MKKSFIKFSFYLFTVLFVSNINAISAFDIKKLHIKKIMLVVAMDKEAGPIISALNLHKIKKAFTNLPMQGYGGKYNKLSLFLITNGQDPVYKAQNVGTQASTLSTYVGIQYFQPDLIISIGTAGGIKKNGAKLKEIYVSKRIYFFDRRIEPKNYSDYGLGKYPSTFLSPIDKRAGLKLGIVCSGDSFDDNAIDIKMMLQERCAVIDMEAAGVAWVSMLTKTPMFAMKGVTDFVDIKSSQNQYEKNFSAVMTKLSIKLKKFLNALPQNKFL